MAKRLVQFAPLLAVLFLALPLAAQTPAPAGDLAGHWHFALNAQDGVHEMDAAFKIEAGKVSGKWAESDVAGSFGDGQMDLSFPFNYADGGLSGAMHLKGKVAGDKITGTWEFAGYTGDFTAARVK